MGASFFTLAVHRGNPEEVSDRIVRWMEAKGFKRFAGRRLFPLNEESERGFYLFTNGEWTVIHYSDIYEYDRLAYELRRINRPSLFLGCSDSDFWGYQLFNGTTQIDEFQTATSSMFWPQDVRETAWRLCQTLGLEDRYHELCKAMRARATFSEFSLQKFCRTLNMFPAGHQYRDIEDSTLGITGVLQFEDFRCEQLFFSRKTPRDVTGILHEVVLNVPDRPREQVDVDNSMDPRPQLPWHHPDRIALQAQILMFKLFFLPYSIGFKIYLRIILFRVWLARRFPGLKQLVDNPDESCPFDRLMTFLLVSSANRQRFESGGVINDHYGCRMAIPEDVEVSSIIGTNEVFRLLRGDMQIQCHAISEQELRVRLRLNSEMKILTDESFFVGKLPARVIIIECDYGSSRKAYLRRCFIQGAEAYYQFEIYNRSQVTPESPEFFKSLVASFELIQREATPDSNPPSI